MRLTCTLGEKIIELLTGIAEKKGEVKAYFLNHLEPASRRTNKIDSVFATLNLQDSLLTKEAVEDILNLNAISAPPNRIKEVRNTMEVYDMLSAYNPFSQVSFRKAYCYLQNNPETIPAYRSENAHFYYHNGYLGLSVPVEEMNQGVKELFHYLRHGKDLLLIKSCLCHYAIQFYQPFVEDNEKMSRLWQTILLTKEHPAFEFLPWEKEILNRRKEYNTRLPGRERRMDATDFVQYMLEIIDEALTVLLASCRRSIRPIDRIRYFYTLHYQKFTRKDYMLVHKNISRATASRDLDKGVELGFFEKAGHVNQTSYRCHPQLD